MRLTAGTAETKITPPVGAPLLGPMQPSTGVHDDLFARALVLSDGTRNLAIVSLDLLGLSIALADEVREIIRRRTGIETVLLTSTHTHSAPSTIPWGMEGWNWFVREGTAWRTELVANVAETVARAASAMTGAALRAGRAPAQAGRCRRLPTPDGIAMKPYDAAPVVPWVDVLCVDGDEGKPLAVLFSHAAHAVVLHRATTLIGADYPGYAVNHVRRHLGSGTLAMFAQACGADINSDPLAGSFEAAERVGVAVGDAAIAAVAAATPVPPGALRVASATFELPFVSPPSVADCERVLAKAEADLRQAQADPAGKAGELCWSRDTVACLRELLDQCRAGTRPALRFDINAIAVGNEWCLLAMTHEVFSEYQLWADRVSPFRHTMVLGYTNGSESYIPTDAALAAGGYETDAFPSLNVAPLRYRHRLALRPGVEAVVKREIGNVLRELARP
ncbi:MAG: neutral/alkaline non-lysosomal ceramidase N-terminal domain-containing protein [Kiritimatiellae bacterium]|nr:neutral/alkaline non-lysosomal ceramidase N-terminal domain-containing protein [Kiritimatiellia bacterium]